VLPATTSAERNDIGGSSRDPNVFFMPQLIAPVDQARNDRDILTDLAGRLGCDEAYNEGRSEETWLRHLWSKTEATAQRQGIAAPDFETFRVMNVWRVPAPDAPEVYLDAFRAEPRQHALGTVSGKIELSSEVIAGFGYGDAPGHPAWLAPEEWLGEAEEDALALLSDRDWDVVLLDYRLPDFDGLEVLAEIRKTHSLYQLPVIVVTGKVAAEDVVDGLHLGANDYVTKPITFPVLEARIKTQIAVKQSVENLLQAERQRVMIESLGAACHHLSQPMTSVMGNLGLLQESLGPDDAAT